MQDLSPNLARGGACLRRPDADARRSHQRRSGRGDFCLQECHVRIGSGVNISDNAGHPEDPIERRTQAVSPESVRPVIIEDDVWIGTQAKIMPGVKIGRGAIVATGSVVTRDVPPMSVVAGAPARFVRRVNANDRVEHIPRARAPRDTEARSTTTRAGKTFARAETAR